MDMQFTPAIIGAVLLFAILGPVDGLELDPKSELVKFSLFLIAATAALLYGFVMHLYSLAYPESPFNKHTSPLFMTGICGGSLAFAAYRLFAADIQTGFILYAVLCILVVIVSISYNIHRNKKV